MDRDSQDEERQRQFARNLRAARERAGLTQAGIAAKTRMFAALDKHAQPAAGGARARAAPGNEDDAAAGGAPDEDATAAAGGVPGDDGGTGEP
jgi:hypothetical protein